MPERLRILEMFLCLNSSVCCANSKNWSLAATEQGAYLFPKFLFLTKDELPHQVEIAKLEAAVLAETTKPRKYQQRREGYPHLETAFVSEKTAQHRWLRTFPEFT